jgi:hypothetical protein
MASLRPRNVAEAQLIHTMAVAHWRKLQVVEAQAIALDRAMDRAMASHLEDSSDPAVQAFLAFESASECHTLHRYETAFDLQADRILRRLLSLRSRTEKNCFAKRTHQDIESKPTAGFSVTVRAALPNPAASAATTLHEGSYASLIPSYPIMAVPQNKLNLAANFSFRLHLSVI